MHREQTPHTTITVGIPAHNEAQTIGRLLRALSAQILNESTITKIIVACDGCTDQTAAIARQCAISDPRIEVWDDGKRLGQAGRLNQMYRSLTSDLFITFDADIKITDPQLITTLIAPLRDPKVGLVGGNNLPNPGKNFIQRAVVRYELAWRSINRQINDGHTVHNMPGCINAVRRSIVETANMPDAIIANDHYLYFLAKKQGYLFRFAKDAVVGFTVPSTIRDFLNQTTRFLSTKSLVIDHYPGDTDEEYSVGVGRKARVYLEYLAKWPIEMSTALLLQLLARVLMPLYVRRNRNKFWTTVLTSKQ